MPDFSIRSNETELMDDLESSGVIIEQTLRELEVINRWLGGNEVTISGIAHLIKSTKNKVSIADVGCGGGDMLKLMAKWGRKRNITLDLVGIDANPNIVAFAKANCKDYPEIRFETLDIFSSTFQQQPYDIITSTLFTHHFINDQLIHLYGGWIKQARLGVVINDLHRHWFAYYSIKWITKWFSKSPMVKNDAAVSVLRAFSKAELKAIMRLSDISHYSLRWRWAFRWQLVIEKDGY